MSVPQCSAEDRSVEHALQVHRHVTERIGFERIAGRPRQLDADVRIFGERNAWSIAAGISVSLLVGSKSSGPCGR